MELKYFFRALLRRKWVIILCVAIAVGATYFLTLNEKKEYSSYAQIATGFTTTDDIKFSDDKLSLPQIDVKFNNLIENFTSPKVLSFLSYDLMLHDLTEKQPFKRLEPKVNSEALKKIKTDDAVKILNDKLMRFQVLDPSVPEEGQLLNYIYLYNYDVGSIQNNLSVNRIPKTDYVNIYYKSVNPNLSAFVVNTLIKEFQNFYSQNRRQRSDTSIATLDSLVRERKKDLDAKIDAKTSFMSSKGIVDVNMEGSNKLQQISNFENQLAQERGNKQNLTYRISQLAGLIQQARAGSSVSSPSNSTTDNEAYITLKNQYNQLYKDYIQKGASDQQMKRDLDDLRRRIQQLQPANTDVSTPQDNTNLENLVQLKLDAEGQLRATNEKINLIQGMINQLNGGLNVMASKGASVEQLEREIQLASGEYTRAKEKLNTALNINGLGSDSFRQTVFGEPAFQPEPTYRWLKIALAGICAFVLSSMVIIFLVFVDNSIKSPSQFQKLTHLKLLGIVNSINFKRNVLQEIGQFNGEDKLRDDTFRELLRKLRYEIENSGKKIFLFTSTEPQQGKTTLIQALSYSLSLVNKKVLIIDTNFCNNDLTTLIAANPVLEKFHLNGKPFRFQDMESFITKTGVHGVDIIGCEGGDYTPREILPHNHLLNYLNELTTVYDFIFLEGAPLNGYTDTKELIHYVDGIIAVFSSESSLSGADKESIKFFKQNEHKFLGAILNKVGADNLDM
ncbi:MAG: exopolysaccharide transport family protein [Flavisolibacter sp.]